MSAGGSVREAIRDLRANWRGAPPELDLRLQRYFLACCRRIWRLLPQEDSRRGVEITEQVLDGQVDAGKLEQASYCAEAAAFTFDYEGDSEDVARWARDVEAIPRAELDAISGVPLSAAGVDARELLKRAAYFVDFAMVYPGLRPKSVPESYDCFLSPVLFASMFIAPSERLRDVAEADFAAIVALNDAEVHQTSAMDVERLRMLVGMSALCRVFTVEGRVVAFLLALRNGAPYENDNFVWFARRLDDFLYVDRIVVDANFSGRKIGSGLYEDLFAFARVQGIGTVTCEYNIEPPNAASRAFHDKFGFAELGTQWLDGGRKRVSLQAANV